MNAKRAGLRIGFVSFVTSLILSWGCGMADGAGTDPAPVGERPQLNGTAYYVAVDGKDTNPGTLEAPWATLQHAAQRVKPGDIVYLRGGVYHQAVYTERSGTPSADIVFSAYQDEKPVLDGTGVDAGNGFVVSNDYIMLKGLEIRNFNGNAVWAEGAAWLDISDCEVHQVTYGIGLADGTHHFTINRVVAHHFDLYGFDASPSSGAPCHHGTFNDCVAHTGRDPDQNVDGFALGHGKQHSFELNRCTTYGVYDGFDISSRDTTLNRCKAYDCGNSGYKVWQDNVELVNCLGYGSDSANLELDWEGTGGTVTVRNCTFVNARTFNVWVENAGDTLRMYNTILAGSRGIGLAFEQRSTKRYQGDYNLFCNGSERVFAVGYEDEFTSAQMAAWQKLSGQDAHSRIAGSLSAIFVDAAGADFHPKASGPALDSASPGHAPSEDLDGNPRPAGAGPDMGAFEVAAPGK
jgi:hypothetical protein